VGSNPLILESQRLVQRPPRPGDEERLAAFVRDNREHFEPWEVDHPPEYFTAAFWERQVEQLAEETRAGRLLSLLVLDREDLDGSILGRCTFSNITRGPFQAAYLGFGLARAAVGKGFMEEALTTAIDYSFGTLRLHRIMANYMPANARSGRLLRKLGFVPEGYARDYLYLAGGWQDHVLTALTNEAWRPPSEPPGPEG
jgi:ribosomal-protein-alanine N-acetyltransferase